MEFWKNLERNQEKNGNILEGVFDEIEKANFGGMLENGYKEILLKIS